MMPRADQRDSVIAQIPAWTDQSQRSSTHTGIKLLQDPWAKCGQARNPAFAGDAENAENPRNSGGFRW